MEITLRIECAEMMKYNLVVCGGTFDHFHKGHKEFLRHILSISSKALVGLTTEKFIKSKKDSEWIEGYRVRRGEIEKFLEEEGARSRVQIEPIDDIFIPKVWENLPIEAVAASKDTIKGAESINLRRKEQGKSLLKIETVPLIKDQNNEYISSSRIRKGEINRKGVPYISHLWFKSKLHITEELRRTLKNPFGVLFQKIQDVKIPKCPYLITVGDITTKNFNELNINKNISVIDFNVARKKKFLHLSELGFSGEEKIFRVKNPAGFLTPALFKAAYKIFKLKRNNHHIVLQLEGEEDLSVLPLILTVPLRSIIFYGQPKKGIVMIEVSEKIKKSAYDLASQFTTQY